MNTIAFITGTRADYGKLKPILKILRDDPEIDLQIFATGMHMLDFCGSTHTQIAKDGFANLFCDENYHYDARMEINLANVIGAFSAFVRQKRPDMIIVHGDRLEAMAGAIVGAFNNILVGHIEGGEVSGTIDESIRHAISKFAQLHFVANGEARSRLIQMGEPERNIFIIGSPDVDIMLSESLPPLPEVRAYYEIEFDDYALLIYHPVVTELENLSRQARILVQALNQSPHNYVVILPNNDPGHEYIRRAYQALKPAGRFRSFPSLRFESFLTLLKNARFIIGNSSAGVREACVYGTPAIDIGSRQAGRYDSSVLKNILHVDCEIEDITRAMAEAPRHAHQSLYFGAGGSAEKFHRIVKSGTLWTTPLQKQFNTLNFDAV